MSADTLYARRQYQRYPCSLPVQVITDSGSFEGTAVNIGLGGMLIVTDKQWPTFAIDSAVNLRFRVPTLNGDTEVTSCVRWSNESAIGVQFIALAAKDIFAIRQFTDEWQ